MTYLVDIGVYRLAADGLTDLQEQDNGNLQLVERCSCLLGALLLKKRCSFIVVSVVGGGHGD